MRVSLFVTSALVLALLAVSAAALKDQVSHSGFVQVDKSTDSNLFFWMFEAMDQSKGAQTPLVIWLTGGPGCSSMMALVTENGPFTVEADNGDGTFKLKDNPYTWNQKAHVIWVDQPVGTGFSYGKTRLHNEKQVAAEMLAFLAGFYKQLPQFAQNPLYITGESFAGHYIPAIAAGVLNSNHAGDTNYPLTGIAIGNGWTDPLVQYPAYAPFMYDLNHRISKGVHDAVLGETALCVAVLKAGLYSAASVPCNLITQTIATAIPKFNVYNIDVPCVVPGLCYNFTLQEDYFNSPITRKQLGIPSHVGKWETCNMGVNLLFRHDVMESFVKLVPDIAKYIPVTFYNGKLDYICNWLGTRDLIDVVADDAYKNAPVTNWTLPGSSDVAGQQQFAGNLKRVTVEGAGHMVPMDQPKVASYMINQILENKNM